MAEESYRAGKTNLLTLIDSQRRLNETRKTYLDSLFAVQSASQLSKKSSERPLTSHNAAPHRSTPRRLVFVLAGLAIALATSSCGRAASTAEKEPSPEVTVTKVQKGAIAQSLLVSGNLATLPNRDAKITALVPGRIQSVLVTEGDSVQAGQVLAHLDSASLRDQQAQADAAVAQARANVENSKLAAEREAGLLQRGISSRKEVEDTRTQLSVNQSLSKQAEAGASAARTQVNRSVLRAPFAGVVVHRFLGNGEQVDGSSGRTCP